MDGTGQPPLKFPWEEPPRAGEAIEVAEGIFWVRPPLPMRLDHVNCYALDEGDHWTLVDTGMNTTASREAWEAVLTGPLRSKPIGRIVITHHHPDHIGLLGWFAERFDVEIWSTRLGYMMARMMTLDVQEFPSEAQIAFRRLSGQPEEGVQAYAQEPAWKFAKVVAPIPIGFNAIRAGETFRMGGRDWHIHFGHGHAPDHATFWTDDVVLAGDQIIPGISSNIGVWALEPEGNPLRDWLESCRRLRGVANNSDALILPGHKLPFHGVDFRLAQLIENHESALTRITNTLADGPHTAAGMFMPIFKRDITGTQYGLALAESVAHMNYLHQAGRVTRTLENEAWVYRLKEE